MRLDLAALSGCGPRLRLALLALTMLAFAGNSLLCRLALQSGGLDPADFTLLRLASGRITSYNVCYTKLLRLTST